MFAPFTDMANVGLGHMVLDAGGAYTYLNPKTRYEFSVQEGFTYNFENNDTLYKNGVDSHTDWGASKFLNKQWQVGGGLLLPAALRRQRIRRQARRLQVARRCRRTAGGLHP